MKGTKNSRKKNAKSRHAPCAVGHQKYGTLYVVSTPIGNLEDITLRALKVLKRVAIIAAENVAHTKGLCAHYGIKTRLTPYNQHNHKTKAPRIVEHLKSGKDVGVVTDAGTPGISDPGSYLVGCAIEEGIEVSTAPGPSALIAALSISGLPTDRFVFQGFLSNKSGRRKRDLTKLATEPRTIVFFEAPHRLRAMLKDLRAVLGDRDLVVVREMTKVFEEVKRGTVSEILDDLTAAKIRGEFTLVVAGAQEGTHSQDLSQGIRTKIEKLMNMKKMSIREIAELVAEEEGLAYRKIYKECIERKRFFRDNMREGATQKPAEWN
jgi:16S rRNA (cytidine1402-2'-O)-methyltransferase